MDVPVRSTTTCTVWTFGTDWANLGQKSPLGYLYWWHVSSATLPPVRTRQRDKAVGRQLVRRVLRSVAPFVAHGNLGIESKIRDTYAHIDR